MALGNTVGSVINSPAGNIVYPAGMSTNWVEVNTSIIAAVKDATPYQALTVDNATNHRLGINGAGSSVLVRLKYKWGDTGDNPTADPVILIHAFDENEEVCILKDSNGTKLLTLVTAQATDEYNASTGYKYTDWVKVDHLNSKEALVAVETGYESTGATTADEALAVLEAKIL